MASAIRRSQSASTGHVARHRHQAVAEVRRQGLQPVGAPGGGHDRGAGGVQHAGKPVAQAAGRPGDDGDATVEAERGGEVDGAHVRNLEGPWQAEPMKVRIGYGLGTRASSDPDRFAALVTGLEAHRFDSLWLSRAGDAATAPTRSSASGWPPACTTKIKFGFSVLVVPGRNPMLLAKELATLDRLSNGRLLPAFGLGAVDPGEHQAFGVERGDRAKIFNEVLPLLRRFWAGETVDHDGAFHHYEGAIVRPLPGAGPARDLARRHRALRAQALSGGWATAGCRRSARPTTSRDGIAVIKETAAEHDRQIDPEHFGALHPLHATATDPRHRGGRHRQAAPRRRPEPHVIAAGLDGLQAMIGEHIEAGGSKFVVIPLGEPDDWDRHLTEVADALLPLQT